MQPRQLFLGWPSDAVGSWPYQLIRIRLSRDKRSSLCEHPRGPIVTNIMGDFIQNLYKHKLEPLVLNF